MGEPTYPRVEKRAILTIVEPASSIIGGHMRDRRNAAKLPRWFALSHDRKRRIDVRVMKSRCNAPARGRRSGSDVARWASRTLRSSVRKGERRCDLNSDYTCARGANGTTRSPR